ncbi:MAG: VWA domain-containing protein [Vicinamibacterales bacterium]
MKQAGIVVGCACLLSAAAQAQTGPAAPARPAAPVFRSGVDLLALDVTVLNGRGDQVTDLAPPDFTVAVDGQPRKVVSAQFIRSDGRDAQPDEGDAHFSSNVDASRGRLVVIAVDQGQIRGGIARPLLLTADRFLSRLAPLDRVAFASLPAPGTFVDFTSDRASVRAALEKVVGQAQAANGRMTIGATEAIAIAERRQIGGTEAFTRECSGLEEEELSRCQRELTAQAQEMVVMQRVATNRSLDALRELLTTLGKVEGQKTLLLISQGLQMDGLGSDVDGVSALASASGVTIHVLQIDTNSLDASAPSAPPTEREDRAARAEGLGRLAGQTRGALYQVSGDGEGVFERLLAELSGYYLVGVERGPSDRDGRRHRIDVSVGRANLTVRSRQAFVANAPTAGSQDGFVSLAAALRAPYQLTEIPLRVTAFVHRDKTPGQVRLLLSADVEQPGQPAGDYTLGFMVVDPENRVVADAVEQRHLRPVDDAPGARLSYSNVAIVAPGTYTLRFGAVDSAGRRGTVFRTVRALQVAGQELVVGDLVIGNLSPTDVILPAIEPLVASGRLAAYTELYAASAATFDQTSVRIEIATDTKTPALLTVPAPYASAAQPGVRAAQAVIPVDLLPPGRYVARAMVNRGGKALGPLTRPFSVLAGDRSSTRKRSPLLLPESFLGPPPKFDKAATLRPDVLGTMLDLVEQATPALRPILAGARQGRFGTAAIAALEAGHQDQASFLRAIELLNKGDLDKAANLLHVAAGPRRTFFPAAFYLGVCFAAAGRDRDAAGVWQMAIGTTARPPIVYNLLVDARWRDGQLAAVVDTLREASQRVPDDDVIARRLALVYAVMGLHAEAMPIFDRYLQRHPDDQDALFAAVLSTYEAGSASGPDREKLARYASAYNGPQKALVSRYAEAFSERTP